jgi:hypothetical protein
MEKITLFAVERFLFIKDMQRGVPTNRKKKRRLAEQTVASLSAQSLD